MPRSLKLAQCRLSCASQLCNENQRPQTDRTRTGFGKPARQYSPPGVEGPIELPLAARHRVKKTPVLVFLKKGVDDSQVKNGDEGSHVKGSEWILPMMPQGGGYQV